MKKNSKKNNKFDLGSLPLNFWSIKDESENRKLRVRTNFSRAVEKIGLIPRSIIRTSDRFRKQLFPGTETLLLQEFRISRYQILVSLKCLLALIFIPLTVHFLTKNFILTPLIEYLWNNNKNDIFLNSTQQEQALSELQDFENEIYFELLVSPSIEESTVSEGGDKEAVQLPFQQEFSQTKLFYEKDTMQESSSRSIDKQADPLGSALDRSRVVKQPGALHPDTSLPVSSQTENHEKNTTNLFPEGPSKALVGTPPQLFFDKNTILNQTYGAGFALKQEFQEKTVALAIKYNQQSIDSLIRLTSDFITILTLIAVILVMKAEIIILKSFLIETVYSFNDTTKSFLIIFFTDLLVGFHSSPGWELFFQSILNRFGLPFTETSILLTVAIVPVFLDTLFKYWIFRYLNKISPTTVATLNAMRE